MTVLTDVFACRLRVMRVHCWRRSTEKNYQETGCWTQFISLVTFRLLRTHEWSGISYDCRWWIYAFAYSCQSELLTPAYIGNSTRVNEQYCFALHDPFCTASKLSHHHNGTITDYDTKNHLLSAQLYRYIGLCLQAYDFRVLRACFI